MTKPEFVRYLAEKNNITLKKALEVVDMYNDTLFECIAAGDSVRFANLFNMGVKDVAARNVLHPQTGEVIHIPSKRTPFCQFGKGIKEAVNGE